MSSRSVDLPASGDHDPDRSRPDGVIMLGALTMLIVIFLALIGQGCPPREALALTLALGVGGIEIAERLPRGSR